MFILKVLKEERYHAKEVRKLREKNNITLTALANKVNVSKSYISRVETGEYSVCKEMKNTIESSLTGLIRNKNKKVILRKVKS